MALVSSILKPHFHARSISLPSISSQMSEFDNFEDTSTSSSTTGQKEMVNEMLDELLSLLELCSTAKDALLMTRDSAQQLHSVLRRKRGDSIGVSSAIQEYQSQRKAVKKLVIKALRNLKGTFSKKKQETSLRDVQSITLNVVESFLCFILGSNLQKKSNKWSMVSKMMGTKRVACDESSEISPVEKVDIELALKSASLQVVHKELSQFEMNLEDHQEVLESIYRNLIKSRVSLLNALNC